MPFYEYECSKCRYYLEVLQKISDAPLRKCPSCGKSALKKLVSAPVFRLKGSGWYETDFKSDQEGRRNLAGADSDAPAPAAEAKDTAKAASSEATKGDAASGPAESAKAAVSEPSAAPAARKSGSGASPKRRGERAKSAPKGAPKSAPKSAAKRPKAGAARLKPKRRGGR